MLYINQSVHFEQQMRSYFLKLYSHFLIGHVQNKFIFNKPLPMW